MRFLVFPLLIIVSIFLLSSCTVKKRAYRSGYYVEWNKHLSHATAAHDKKTKTTEKVSPSEITNETILSEEEMVSASSEKIITPKTKTNAQKNIFSDDCGDIITMKNGDEVKGKVIEINSTEVKYKRCDNLDGPLITVNKSDVFMIKYVNGSKEVFNTTKENTKEKNSSQNAKTNIPVVHPLSRASLVCGILCIVCLILFVVGFALTLGGALVGAVSIGGVLLLFLGGVGFFVTAILALVFGIIALVAITKNPNKFYGRGNAIAGVVIGGLVVLLLLLSFLKGLGI